MAFYRGAGTVIEIGSTSDPTTASWTVLSQCTNLRVNETAGQLDVTNLASSRKEYIQDLPESAEISFTMQYDPSIATQGEVSGLEKLFNDGERRAFRITPNGSTRRERYPACFVTSKNRTFDPTAVQTMEITLRANGATTYVPVA